MQPSLDDHLVGKLFATSLPNLAHEGSNTGAHSALGLEKERHIRPEVWIVTAWYAIILVYSYNSRSQKYT